MLPKVGKAFRSRARDVSPHRSAAQLVAEALRGTLQDSHRAVKTVMRWTGANERTVKNWLSGTHGPHGDYLLLLIGNSDAVLDAVINTLPTDRLSALTVRLVQKTGSSSQIVVPLNALLWTGSATRDRGYTGIRYRGPARPSGGNGPTSDPDAVPNRGGELQQLNDRQAWFLGELRSGAMPRACDLSVVHSVSEKTAKRDIADLRRRQLIRFVGTKRRGHYTFISSR